MNVTDKKIGFPTQRMNAQTIKNTLSQYKTKDLPWKTGRVFAYVYEAEPEVKASIEDAYLSFLGENGLDPTAFPSLLRLEREVVGMVCDLLHGENAVGNFTSGGTESIILAVKAARDYARLHRPEITAPEIVLPLTAHAAFQKAAHYLGLNVVLVPVSGPDFSVKLEDMQAALTENTLMLVGSAPCYPYGVMDPIEDLANLATEKGLWFHVDACVGGMYLPFLEEVPVFDFRLKGVASMSCDLHKYGYAAKGASCVLYRDENLRRHQIFTCSNWAGYSIVNPTVLSSKTGGPLAGAWAALQSMGREGYEQIAQATQAATTLLIEGIAKEIPALEVLGQPVMNLVAIASKDARCSVFGLAEWLKTQGWYVQVQLASDCSAETLHLNINRANCPHIAEFLEALKAGVAQQIEAQTPALDLPMDLIAYFLDNFSPELFEQFKGFLGMDSEDVPEDFRVINELLNALNPAQRDLLLNEFVNQLFK